MPTQAHLAFLHKVRVTCYYFFSFQDIAALPFANSIEAKVALLKLGYSRYLIAEGSYILTRTSLKVSFPLLYVVTGMAALPSLILVKSILPLLSFP